MYTRVWVARAVVRVRNKFCLTAKNNCHQSTRNGSCGARAPAFSVFSVSVVCLCRAIGWFRHCRIARENTEIKQTWCASICSSELAGVSFWLCVLRRVRYCMSRALSLTELDLTPPFYPHSEAP